MNRILLLLIFCILPVIPALAQNPVVLNQKQAVEVAEKFVAENGYTDKAPSNKKNLFLETGEKFSHINKIIASRFNLIELYPVIALIKDINGQSVWSVQFLFIKQDYQNQEEIKKEGNIKTIKIYDYGREVRMSPDGKKIWMESKPIAIQEARLFGDCTGESEKTQLTEKP